jgi:nucleoside-diphosphate-sugar epimerase
MIHLEDLANLFLAAYENPNSTGRYFGVYDSLHWQDIYGECKKLLPLMQMPDPISEDAVQPTNFDLTRRNSLGVNIRDFPTLLQQTIQWIKSDPFTTTN